MERRKQGIRWMQALVGALLLWAGGGGAAPLQAKAPPPPEPDLPTGGVTLAGKHVVIHALPIEQANARFLADLADAVLETYARDLGAPVPADPIAVYVLDTDQDYEHADTLYGTGTCRFNPGFSQGGRVFLHFAPRPGQTVLGTDSMITHLLAHELCHALHQRLFLGYSNQPKWLQEGLADAWAERALSGNDTLMADRSVFQGSKLIVLRRAMQQGDSLSIKQILKQPYSDYANSDGVKQYLTYCRSFALIRMLDDPTPENAARRARFRSFLREADFLYIADRTPTINALFLKEFGDRNLGKLQAELRTRIATEKGSPWEQYGTEVCLLADGAQLAEAAPDQTALAFADTPRLSATAHLHARIEAANFGRGEADLAFGRTTRDDFYLVAFRPGDITLFRHSKSYEALENLPLNTNQFGPGAHILDLTLRPQQVEVRLDDRLVGTFPLRSGAFPSGQWGIGASDGRITFHEVTAQDDLP